MQSPPRSQRSRAANSKSEVRNPKQIRNKSETNPKSEVGNVPNRTGFEARRSILAAKRLQKMLPRKQVFPRKWTNEHDWV